MKIDWWFVGILVAGFGSIACGVIAGDFEDDMLMYVDLKLLSLVLLICGAFMAVIQFNERHDRQIAELHLGIEEVMTINDELRREIDAQKVEKQENP